MQRGWTGDAGASSSTTTTTAPPGIRDAPDFADDANAECDACPYCDDVCGNPKCMICSQKMRRKPTGCTLCQVRRHTTPESCWIVANHNVYDVTTFLPRHPAGTFSIVRHAGGRDCSEDLAFHSTKAQRLWNQHKIGRLVPCPSEGDVVETGGIRRFFSWLAA